MRPGLSLAVALGVGLAVSPQSLAARPNLSVTRVVNPPRTVTQSGTLAVGDTVRLSGAARPTVTGYFLSRNSRRDRGDLILTGARSTARGRLTGRARVVVPSFIPPGRYRLLACADAGRRVRERSEADNCRAAARTLTVRRLRRTGPLNA